MPGVHRGAYPDELCSRGTHLEGARGTIPEQSTVRKVRHAVLPNYWVSDIVYIGPEIDAGPHARTLTQAEHCRVVDPLNLR